MRWLFLIALFLNLAYISWQLFVPAKEIPFELPVLNNVEPIILLSELKQGKEVDSAVAAVDLSQKSAEPEPELEDEAESISDEAVIVDQEGIEKQGIAEEVFAEPRDNVVAEAKGEMVAELEESGSTEVSQAGILESENCFTVGPFHDLDKLRNLTREIKPYVMKTDFRGQEETRLSVYWVYLPPEKNRKQAIKTGKRLKDKKIKDFYIIREGEKNNGISLGYFKNKNSALRLEKKVKELGFEVQVEPKYKIHTVYWLDYQLVSGLDIPEGVIEKYSQSTEADKAARLSRDCGI